MKKHIWFGQKRYGWGWTPVTWQGWLVVIVFTSAFTLVSLPLKSAVYPLRYVTIIYLPSLVILFGFLFIFFTLTGERPTWRWGTRRKLDSPASKMMQERKTE